MNEVGTSLAMALLAMTSVGLWTLRVALTARARKLLGAGVAAVEAVVFALAFTSLASNLDSPASLLGYAAGVALGTLLGLVINERLPAGISEVDIVVDGHDPRLAETLHGLGWVVATFPGEAPWGAVTLLCIAVEHARLRELTDTVRRVAPEAFWTVQELGQVHAAALPAGFIKVRS